MDAKLRPKPGARALDARLRKQGVTIPDCPLLAAYQRLNGPAGESRRDQRGVTTLTSLPGM